MMALAMLEFSRQITIEWGDCDPAGIVFYPRYLAMFNASTDAMIASTGIHIEALFKRHSALGWPMVDTRAVFTFPTRFGEQARIDTKVSAVHYSSFELHHALYNQDGRLAVTGHDKRVWAVSHPHQPDEIKSAAIPEELRIILLG